MRNRKNILGIIAIGVFFTLSACKSVAVLPTNTPVKNVDVNALASKIKGNYPKANRLRSRIRAVYDDGKRQQQIIVQLRMEAQKTVWMSASMVIPIAKLMVTKQGVSFYEKFQKFNLLQVQIRVRPRLLLQLHTISNSTRWRPGLLCRLQTQRR